MDQQLSVKAMDHDLDLCRVKGREMAFGGAIDLSKKEVKFIRGRTWSSHTPGNSCAASLVPAWVLANEGNYPPGAEEVTGSEKYREKLL